MADLVNHRFPLLSDSVFCSMGTKRVPGFTEEHDDHIWLCQHLKLQLISFLLSGVFWYLEEGLKCTGVLPPLPHVAPRARTTGKAGSVGYRLTKLGLLHYQLVCVMLAAGMS